MDNFPFGYLLVGSQHHADGETNTIRRTKVSRFLFRAFALEQRDLKEALP
jgi:hypothetical protein